MAYRTATNGTWEKLAEARENRSLVCHFTKSQVKILLKNIANSLFINCAAMGRARFMFYPWFIFFFVRDQTQTSTWPTLNYAICNVFSPNLVSSGSTVASWLVRSSPDRAVQVRALAGDIVLCSWARHFTLTVLLSTQVYKWVPANLMLGVTLRWTSIPSRGGVEILLVTSCYRNRDKLRPDGPLGSHADFTLVNFICNFTLFCTFILIDRLLSCK